MATRLQSVTFSRASMALVIEPETMRDLITFLQDEGETLGTLFGDDMETVVSSISTVPVAVVEEAAPAAEGATAPEAPKTRKSRKPAEAVAPAPIPVPSAAASAVPSPGTSGSTPPAPPAPAADPLDIPAYLQRAPTPPAPPPLLPAAPALVPNAPGGPVAQKVVKELERRASSSLDKGQALADWLAAYGVTQAGASYADALTCIATSVADEKLVPIATALGV